MHPFQEFLIHRLTLNLPGEEAQNRMRPYPSSYLSPSFKSFSPPEEGVRNSSVLVPIITWKKELEIILTLRTRGIKHAGQLSFPGGGKEGTETYAETALRESHEEIGLIEDHVSVCGMLSPLYVDRSNNLVTPVVGFIHEAQVFSPNPNEVAEVFTVPLVDLVNDANHNIEQWSLMKQEYTVPFWDVHHVPLWGATAMMMNELVELYREFLGK